MIKQFCKAAGVANIDAGPKGVVGRFRNNRFANPQKLATYITARPGELRVCPDQKLVYLADWTSPKDRLAGVNTLLVDLNKAAA